MKVSDFTFDLPEELIAQDPLEDRSSSRLLTLDKNTGEIGHDVFHNIVNYLKSEPKKKLAVKLKFYFSRENRTMYGKLL